MHSNHPDPGSLCVGTFPYYGPSMPTYFFRLLRSRAPRVEITNEILWPRASECQCHGPYAHPVAVAMDHQMERKFWATLLGDDTNDRTDG